MTTYYVDAQNGSDQSSGTSKSAAWKSVDKVNHTNLKPGDTVLFRAGDVYHEGLEITDSGTAEAPITFGAWGTGMAPVFSGAVDVVKQAWTQTAANVWSTSLPKTGWFPPEKLQIDGETANVRAAGPAGVSKDGDWAWSSGTLYVYSEGHPATAHGSIEAAMGNYGILINEVDHIRIVRLAADMANQGIIVRDSTGSELIKVEASDNARNGINLKGATDTLVEGGSSHDNGIDGLGTSTKHLGHGVVFMEGAHDNVVRGMMLVRNAEDGVQFSNGSGSGNRVEASRIADNREDGVDVKGGSQTLAGNGIEGNADHGVLLHNSAGLITIAGNTIRTEGTGNALFVSEGASVDSSGNVYGADRSYTVRISSNAGHGSIFTRDTFVDGGAVSGSSVLLSGGGGHRFDQSTFVMRESGYALQVKLAASGTIVSNSILYGQGLLQMDGGTGMTLKGNLYWGTGRSDAWARVDGPMRLYGRDFLLGRDGAGIAADPRFTDPGTDDFSLLPSSPDGSLGAVPLGDSGGEPLPPPPEEPAESVPPVAEAVPPSGWESAPTLTGTAFADIIEGTSQSEWIRGLEGNDELKGKGGHDAIEGHGGADTLLGGGGDDLLAGGAGDDLLLGDSGLDTAWYGDAPGGVTVDLKITGAQATGHGQDRLGGIENLVGSAFGDRLYGTGGNNVLRGGAGDDFLDGRSGSDRLLGGGGEDTLRGGGGVDTLDGGLGDDLLTGGPSADLFVFRAGGGRDTITDLDAEDRIRLRVDGFDRLADVLAHAHDVGTDLVIDLGGADALVLEGVQAEDLTAAMFVF